MPIKTVQIIRKLSLKSWGGAETVLWNCSRELSISGNKTDVVATSTFHSEGVKPGKWFDVSFFPYTYAKMNLPPENAKSLDTFGGNPFSFDMLAHLKSSDSDLLHCHSMGRLAQQTKKAAKSLGIPYVLSIHGQQNISEYDKIELKELCKNSFDYGFLLDLYIRNRNYLQYAHGIVCHSKEQYQLLSRRFPNKLIEFIPNGVNPQKFHPDAEAGASFKKEFGISEDVKVVLCVSRFGYMKNQRLLLKMMNQLKSEEQNVHLVLIGNIANQSYFDKLNLDVKKLNLQDSVTIIAGLASTDPRLVAAYEASDVFILPSIKEPFGIVCLEAWASGVPVIASNTGGLTDLIEHRETGLLFEPNSLEALVDKYYIMSKSASLRERVIKNGSLEVENKYAWRIIVKKLEQFYQKVSDKFYNK
ncbi:MAG: glycosyltransferase family 4 protein [Lentisphaeria bacterium]|nr:glycosyltransferase family 4 protein [Lentisphaeria bacterium]